MWQLVIKDLYLQRRRLTLLSILTAAAVGMMFFKTDFGSNGFYPALLIFLFAITYTYTLYSCFTEDRNKGMMFLRTLPVSARTIVNSKFMGVIVLEFMMMVMVYLIVYAGKWAGFLAAKYLSMDFGYLFLVGLTVLLFNSIVLLIYFRWGYNRMQMIYTISFFVVFFGGLAVGKAMPAFTIFIGGFTTAQAAVFGLLLAVLLELLCWLGSISALKRRDLL